MDIGWMTKSTVIQKTRWLMSMPELPMKLWNGSKRSQEERRSRKVTAMTFRDLKINVLCFIFIMFILKINHLSHTTLPTTTIGTLGPVCTPVRPSQGWRFLESRFAIVAEKYLLTDISDLVTFYVSYTRLLIDFTTRLNWTLNWL